MIEHANSAVNGGGRRATALLVVLVAMCGTMQVWAGDQDWTVRGEGSSMPDSYVPVMLSNGSLCMTADHLGGVPFPSDQTRRCQISTGIFIAGRRLLYNIYGHGSYRLTLPLDTDARSADGKINRHKRIWRRHARGRNIRRIRPRRHSHSADFPGHRSRASCRGPRLYAAQGRGWSHCREPLG